MRTVYLAGPMRGYPNDNVQAFERAADFLRHAGAPVVSPVEIGAALRADVGSEPTPAQYLRADLAALLGCDAIALLPGWEHSTGARCEATVAVTLGYPFYDATSGLLIAPPAEIVCRGGYERPVELPSRVCS